MVPASGLLDLLNVLTRYLCTLSWGSSVAPISFITRALVSLPHLALLHSSLHQNRLIDLPSELGNATDLIWLSLNCNHLTKLPESIGQLTNMARLSAVR